MESKEPIRLQKFIAEAGICSRRAAETLIEEGRVAVDGKVAELGQKVIPGQHRVVVNGRLVKLPSKDESVVLLMNKPAGYVCTNADPHASKTVFDLLPPPLRKKRLFCAGRLDKDSEGMLILTSDGDLAQRLTHPSNRVTKRYRVTLTRPFDPKHIKPMLNGFEVEGERLKVEKVIQAKRGIDPEKNLEIHLEHGRKREIRRILETLGYTVARLSRFQIGRLPLRGVGPGNVRHLTRSEVEQLFNG